MKRLIVIVFAILGMIVGVSFGATTVGMNGLNWLSIGGEIGVKTPIVLDLGFLQFTVGFWCKINIAGVLFMVVFALVSKKVLDWLKI